MYLNFFPGSVREDRSLTLDPAAGYAVEDIKGFVGSVIAGCTSSLLVDDAAGLRDALEDGEVFGAWFGDQDNETETDDQRAQREAVEEVHHALGMAL